MAPRPRRTRNPRPESSESESSASENDDVTRIWSFVPHEGIDIEALAWYIRAYVDDGATIQPGRHPTDRSRTGYLINSKFSLGAHNIADIKQDSKEWVKEKRRANDGYINSRAVRLRRQDGPSAKPPPNPSRTGSSREETAQGRERYDRTDSSNTRVEALGSRIPTAAPDRHGSLPLNRVTSPAQQPLVDPRVQTDRDRPERREAQSDPSTLVATFTQVQLTAPQGSNTTGRHGEAAYPPPYQATTQASRGTDYKPSSSQPSTTGAQGWTRHATAGPEHDNYNRR